MHKNKYAHSVDKYSFFKMDKLKILLSWTINSSVIVWLLEV
ncbi:conserved hypothetical protein (plasmid) [Borreliella afzelii ACA-1]|nr:conserved hypothetical protein [Borreliella afzelii ACA-1]